MPYYCRRGLLKVPYDQAHENHEALVAVLSKVELVEQSMNPSTQEFWYVIQHPALDNIDTWSDPLPEYDADIHPDNTVTWTRKHG